MTLLCPREGAQVRPFRIADITVDTCVACGGTWFDAGELSAVTHHTDLEGLVAVVAKLRPSFACPRCGGSCHAAKLGSIEIDQCETCRGVWFDKGELTRLLLARATGRASGPTAHK